MSANESTIFTFYKAIIIVVILKPKKKLVFYTLKIFLQNDFFHALKYDFKCHFVKTTYGTDKHGQRIH